MHLQEVLRAVTDRERGRVATGGWAVSAQYVRFQYGRMESSGDEKRGELNKLCVA